MQCFCEMNQLRGFEGLRMNRNCQYFEQFRQRYRCFAGRRMDHLCAGGSAGAYGSEVGESSQA